MENYSFDTKTGKIAVDYKSWIGKQNIIYERPILQPSDAAMIGNGRIGAAVWNDQDITMQVTAVDASPYTAYSSGWVSLETVPPMKQENEFLQIMNLYDGTVDTKFGSQTETKIFGDADQELLGIHVCDRRENVTEIKIRLSIWDTSILKQRRLWNTCDDFEEWKEVIWENHEDYAMLIRGNHTKHGFGYALAVAVDGSKYKIQQINENICEISVEPSEEYTIWIANPSKINHPGEEYADIVKKLIGRAKEKKASEIIEKSKEFWHGFWERSFIEFSDKSENGEYIENMWYDTNYMLATASRATYPCHFNNGIFRWDGDYNVRWSAYYTYFNQRAINNHWLTANHMDMIRPYLNHFLKVMPRFIEDTKKICEMDGMKVPEAYDWDGGGMYDDPNNYTGRIHHDALEISLLMYQYAEHTQDAVFLKEKCYPFLREAVRFYCCRMKFDGEYYHMCDSNSLEMYWDVTDPITDITSVRVVFPLFLQLSAEYGEDMELRQKARHILEHIVPLETVEKDGKLIYQPCASPVPEWKNLQNPEMEMMFPMGYVGIDSPDYEIAKNTWMSRNFDYTIWSPDAAAAARIGMGDAAYEGIEYMCYLHQIRACGFHDDGNGAFESNGLVNCAVNEMLLQSYNGKIRVFAAMPQKKKFQAAFTLHAMGGFLISSEYQNQTVKYVGIRSDFGRLLQIYNPWKGEKVRLVCCTTSKEILVTNADIITAGTQPGHVYILERVDKPVDEMNFTVKEALPNLKPRRLSLAKEGTVRRQFTFWKVVDGEYISESIEQKDIRILGYEKE